MTKEERLAAKIERLKAMLPSASGNNAKQIETALERAQNQLKELGKTGSKKLRERSTHKPPDLDSHTQYFGPGNQPFHTQDALLAACLYFAGIPFWNPVLPCIHRYNAKILNRLGYSGIPLEEAAQKAFKSGKRGNVEYL